jgi:hypothetical protein
MSDEVLVQVYHNYVKLKSDQKGKFPKKETACVGGTGGWGVPRLPVERLKSRCALGFLEPRSLFKEGGHWVWALLFGLTWEESLYLLSPA